MDASAPLDCPGGGPHPFGTTDPLRTRSAIRHGAFLITPDAVALGVQNAIIDRLATRAATLEMAWVPAIPAEEVGRLYGGAPPWTYGWRLKHRLFALGPSLLLRLGVPVDAWETIRALKGPNNPYLLKPGTIRGELGCIGTVVALVHAADTLDQAADDLARLWPVAQADLSDVLVPFRLSPGAPRCFEEVLARLLEWLGDDRTAARLREPALRSPGPKRLHALLAPLDEARASPPPLSSTATPLHQTLCDHARWDASRAEVLTTALRAAGQELDAWSNLLLESRICFFRRERDHAPG